MSKHKDTPNTSWRNTLLAIAMACGMLCLTGCGQKGPLVMPKVTQQSPQR
jgi:predicted small lipoprotein YifL